MPWKPDHRLKRKPGEAIMYKPFYFTCKAISFSRVNRHFDKRRSKHTFVCGNIGQYPLKGINIGKPMAIGGVRISVQAERKPHSG